MDARLSSPEGKHFGGRSPGSSYQPQLLARNPVNLSQQQKSQGAGAPGLGRDGGGSWKLPQAQKILLLLCSFSPNWKDHIFTSLHSGQFRCTLQRLQMRREDFNFLCFSQRAGTAGAGRLSPGGAASASKTFRSHHTLHPQVFPGTHFTLPSPGELVMRGEPLRVRAA